MNAAIEARRRREITEVEAEIDNKKGEIKELQDSIEELELALFHAKNELERELKEERKEVQRANRFAKEIHNAKPTQ